MTQQINLYRPIFRRQEKKFSVRAMAQAGASIVVVVILLYGAMWWQLREMRSALRSAEQQQIAATKRLQDAAQQLGTRVPNESPADKLARLEREVAALRQIQQTLGHQLIVNKGGYSEYFMALARQHMSGLWLTGVTISDAGQNLSLQGRTVDAVNVPRYVQRLSAERILAGKEFEVVLIASDKPRTELQFSLKTGADKDQQPKGARRS